MIERSKVRAGEDPSEIRFLRAGIVRVTASRGFLECLLEEEDLGAASASDVDLWPWLSY